jgi:hypothetical protein
MRIGTQTIAGQSVEIHASTQGRWSITMPDTEDRSSLGSGETLEAAIEQARRAIAKRKVRFITLTGDKGVATGRHAANRDILVRIGEKAERLDDYARALQPDTPAEELTKLTAAKATEKQAQREQRRIENEYKLELGRAVDAAIEAKIAEQEPAAAGGA